MYDFDHFGTDNKDAYAVHRYSASWRPDWKVLNKLTLRLGGASYILRKYKKRREAPLPLGEGVGHPAGRHGDGGAYSDEDDCEQAQLPESGFDVCQRLEYHCFTSLFSDEEPCSGRAAAACGIDSRA